MFGFGFGFGSHVIAVTANWRGGGGGAGLKWVEDGWLGIVLLFYIVYMHKLQTSGGQL